MEPVLKLYLNKLAEVKIYPFSVLEINFFINLVWVILRSVFKSSADYRVAKLGDEGPEEIGSFSFLQYKIVVFIYSFMLTFLFSLSLDFWVTYSGLGLKNAVWWLPSVIAIVLAEVSHLIAQFLPSSQTDDLDSAEKEIDNSSRQLPVYFVLSLLVLGIFWLYMLTKGL